MLHTQPLQRPACAHHIQNRIHRAHLMKMHAIGRCAMHPRLRFRQPREDRHRAGFDGLAQRGVPNNLHHIAEVAVRLLFGDSNLHAPCENRVHLHALGVPLPS